MRMLDVAEMNDVNAGCYAKGIHPSDWMFSAGFGATMGTFTYMITAFSAHPAGIAAIFVGTGIAVGIHATHDLLQSAGL